MSVDFRGFPACDCQAAWLPAYEHELQRRDILTGTLAIAQLIGFFSGSGSTHTGGGAGDFWLTGERAERAVWVARQMGADATWHRLPGWDNGSGSEHIHSVLRGCPHLSTSAAAQVWAVDHNGDGLAGDLPDTGPRPPSGRTWREGIAWAQEEELMATAEEKIREIVLGLAPQLADAVWAHVVRKADPAKGITEQDAEAALKKAANR